MKLSVIILNYNVRYFLELCIKSVQEAIKTIDAEIIVIDNNSKDDSCQMIKQLFPDIKLIENPENVGFSKGNNIGVQQAKGEYVCILNPDTVVAEDTFIKLLNYADAQNNCGIVSCKFIDGTGSFLPECKRNIPTPLVSLKKVLGFNNSYYANHLQKNETGKVDVIAGAFMIMKRELYNEVKGFDEDYFMFGDDMDLSYKVLKAGYHNYYNSETTIIHFKGESTFKNKTYAKYFNNAMRTFFNKHFKLNSLTKFMISFGIKARILFASTPKVKETITTNYQFVSSKENELINHLFNDRVSTAKKLSEVKPNTLIIFDANLLSFKEIIKQMENNSDKLSISYKILPKNCNYIIGSNSSISKGEVIQLN